MQYKTIVLELIQQQPALHERLKAERKVLATVDQMANLFKTNHEAQIELLRLSRPEADYSQLASEALEITLQEIEAALQDRPTLEEAETLSLDDAMAFLKRTTPRG